MFRKISDSSFRQRRLVKVLSSGVRPTQRCCMDAWVRIRHANDDGFIGALAACIANTLINVFMTNAPHRCESRRRATTKNDAPKWAYGQPHRDLGIRFGLNSEQTEQTQNNSCLWRSNYDSKTFKIFHKALACLRERKYSRERTLSNVPARGIRMSGGAQ